jgi:Protein of unknown function (DUF2867)
MVPGAYFHDAWAIATAHPELSALEQFLLAAQSTPRWVDVCMNLRNQVVSRLGLKDLGQLAATSAARSAADYSPGDRVGIFTLFENHPDEVLLGDKDKHLDVTLSVHRSSSSSPNLATVVTVTTVVHVHNLLGRLYMLPVTPMHRIIAPAVLKAVGKAA